MWCMDFIEMQAWCVKFEVRCDLPPEVYVTHDYFSFILWKYQIFSWNLTLKKRDLKFLNLNLWCMNCWSKYTQCLKFSKICMKQDQNFPFISHTYSWQGKYFNTPCMIHINFQNFCVSSLGTKRNKEPRTTETFGH